MKVEILEEGDTTVRYQKLTESGRAMGKPVTADKALLEAEAARQKRTIQDVILGMETGGVKTALSGPKVPDVSEHGHAKEMKELEDRLVQAMSERDAYLGQTILDQLMLLAQNIENHPHGNLAAKDHRHEKLEHQVAECQQTVEYVSGQLSQLFTMFRGLQTQLTALEPRFALKDHGHREYLTSLPPHGEEEMQKQIDSALGVIAELESQVIDVNTKLSERTKDGVLGTLWELNSMRTINGERRVIMREIDG